LLVCPRFPPSKPGASRLGERKRRKERRKNMKKDEEKRARKYKKKKEGSEINEMRGRGKE